MYRQRSLALALTVLATFVAGCAGAGGSRPEERSGPNRLVRSELAPYNDIDAYGAVLRLRSNWLRPRGGSRNAPALIVDSVQRIGGIAGLRTIPVSAIEEMEYMNGPDATMRYGTGFSGGAVLVYLIEGRARTTPERRRRR